MVRKFKIVIIIIKIHCLQYKYSFVTNYTVTLHYTDHGLIMLYSVHVVNLEVSV